MSYDRITEKCPICGDEMAIENFQHANVWKDGKKQELFVCRFCAIKAQRKRKWTNLRDAFDAEKAVTGDAGGVDACQNCGKTDDVVTEDEFDEWRDEGVSRPLYPWLIDK